MSINKEDIKVERIRGSGPGGSNRNKVSSCIRVTHIPTGITVTIDARNQHQNLCVALKELELRLKQLKADKKAQVKKEDRDYKIHNTKVIRTYNYSRGLVKDHRTGKTASIKEIMDKGRLDLLK